MKHILTEKQFKEMINETVNDVLKRIGVINEMAVPLKDYRARVDGLRFQLVENWCLCKWCQLFNPECENFAHWVTELKACIDNLKFLDIKNGILIMLFVLLFTIIGSYVSSIVPAKTMGNFSTPCLKCLHS